MVSVGEGGVHLSFSMGSLSLSTCCTQALGDAVTITVALEVCLDSSRCGGTKVNKGLWRF